MTKKSWLHFGLLGTAMAGFGVVVACSSNDIVNPTPGQDASTGGDSAVEVPDTGTTTDSGPDAAATPFPKVALVHGSTAVGFIKLCLAGDTTGEPAITGPNAKILPTKILPTKLPPGVPGVPPGAVAPLPFKQVNPEIYNLVAIAIKPAAIARVTGLSGGTEPDCGTIMADAVLEPTASGTDNTGKALVENKDFFLFASIKAGSFKGGKSYIGIATGCPKGIEGAGQAKCGATYDSNKGNLRVVGYELDTTTKAGANNGVQFIHASQEADGVLPSVVGGAEVKPWINLAPAAADAGSGGAEFLGSDVTFASTVAGGKPVPAPALVTKAPISIAASTFGIQTKAGNDIGAGVGTWAGITVGGTPPADFYKPGRNYTFIAVGDPSQPTYVAGADGGLTFNPFSFGFRAIDNDFVVPDLSQF